MLEAKLSDHKNQLVRFKKSSAERKEINFMEFLTDSHR